MLYAHYHYRIFADDLSSRAALEILQSRRCVAGLSDTPQTFTNTTALWKLAGSTSQLGCSPQSHACSGNVFCFSEAKPPKSFDTAISSSFTAMSSASGVTESKQQQEQQRQQHKQCPIATTTATITRTKPPVMFHISGTPGAFKSQITGSLFP